jgi:hypothetical protein
MDLGTRGGALVEGGRIESVGDEPIGLLGGGEDGRLLMLSLDPGQTTTIAPPPFAPFHRGLLPPRTVGALKLNERPDRALVQREVAAITAPPPEDTGSHTKPGSTRLCPMCNKVHSNEARVELAA